MTDRPIRTMTLTIDRIPRTLAFGTAILCVEELGTRLPFARKPVTLSDVGGCGLLKVYVTETRFLTPDEFDALARNNESFSGGFIEHRAERYTVRGTGLAMDEADLRRIVVASTDGVPVFVSDVADVMAAPMPRYGAVTRDGLGETLAGMVIMLKGENGKAVAERVKARIDEIGETLHGHEIGREEPRCIDGRHRIRVNERKHVVDDVPIEAHAAGCVLDELGVGRRRRAIEAREIAKQGGKSGSRLAHQLVDVGRVASGLEKLLAQVEQMAFYLHLAGATQIVVFDGQSLEWILAKDDEVR